MSSVAERHEAFLAEHGRFLQLRGSAAPPWLRELRQRGADRFARLGFPTVRQEEWRFTNVAPIAETPFRLPEKAPTNAVECISRVAIPDAAARIVVLNGRFSPELSDVRTLPAGAFAGGLADAIGKGVPEVAIVGQLAWEHAPFTALNTAFLDDGAFLMLPPRSVLDGPIQVIVVNGGAGKIMAHPRTLIVAGSGSEARIAQTFVGAAGDSYFTNAVTEVNVGDGAVIEFYTDQRETDLAYHIAAVHARVERAATFRTRTVTLGGKLLRNDTVAVLDGEGAHCTLDGCYLVDGDRLVDNHTTIDHATPNCTSHELYKGILDGRAKAIFNGRIIVRLDAQKTDSKQTNRALLLSDEATINSNPQLEIFADDVKCTHGAAIGQLDEEALFYLQARGLTRKDARDLLIHAYAGEVLEGIAIEHLKNQLLRELFVQLDRDLADHERS
jgi:Fe-S cluster assembly protein SufD